MLPWQIAVAGFHPFPYCIRFALSFDFAFLFGICSVILDLVCVQRFCFFSFLVWPKGLSWFFVAILVSQSILIVKNQNLFL